MVNYNPFSMKKIGFCILLFATVRLAAQGSLSGIVISPYGDAEHGVSVELFTNSSDRFDDKIDTLVAQTLTDITGYYRIEGIASGTYAALFNRNQGDNGCITKIMVGVKIADVGVFIRNPEQTVYAEFIAPAVFAYPRAV